MSAKKFLTYAFSRLSRFNIINWLAPDVIVEDSVISWNITHAREILPVLFARQTKAFLQKGACNNVSDYHNRASSSGRHLLYSVSPPWLSVIRVINKNNHGLEIREWQKLDKLRDEADGGLLFTETDTGLAYGSRFVEITQFALRLETDNHHFGRAKKGRGGGKKPGMKRRVGESFKEPYLSHRRVFHFQSLKYTRYLSPLI